MGLFSGKRKTFVSSVVYNLAGDINLRPNFLKTTIFGHITNSPKGSLGKTIADSYLNGPGVKFKNFTSWAKRTNFNSTVGMGEVYFSTGFDLNKEVVLEAIRSKYSIPLDVKITLQALDMGYGDYTYWADKYMIENHYKDLNTNWTVSYEEGTRSEPLNIMKITFEQGNSVQFPISGYNSSTRYLYIVFNTYKEEESGDLIYGDRIDLNQEEDWPSLPNSVKDIITTSNPIFAEGRKKEIKWDNGVLISEIDTTFMEGIFMKTSEGTISNSEYIGVPEEGADAAYTKKVVLEIHEETTIVEEQTSFLEEEGTITTYTVIWTPKGVPVRWYRRAEQTVKNIEWNPPQMWIYEEGGGYGELNNLFIPKQGNIELAPYIPIRVDNLFVSEIGGEVFNKCKKAIKKSLGTSYKKIENLIKETNSLDDIDYAYIVFGISLNSKEKTAKEYIYKFFDYVHSSLGSSAGEYISFRNKWDIAFNSWINWAGWREEQASDNNNKWEYPTEPTREIYPEPPVFSLRVTSEASSLINYDINIQWNGLGRSTGLGKYTPDAKKGDVWIEFDSVDKLYRFTYGNSAFQYMDEIPIDVISITQQVTKDSYVTYKIYGLKHINTIYGGKAVEIYSKDSLDDPEESGFLIPLAPALLKEMSLVNRTQLSTASSYLVFNCYEVVKQKWYQTGLFKVLIVIASIVISVYAPVTGAGVLGTNATVGAALGFAAGGTAALVAGAAANAIAAMLIVKIFSVASSALFGEGIGNIIGVIAGAVAIAVGTSFMSIDGATFSSALGSLSRSDNLLQLSLAGMDGVSAYLNSETQEYIAKTQSLINEYKKEMQDITNAYRNTFTNSIEFDLYGYLNRDTNSAYVETPDMFLARTSLNPYNIVDVSLGLVTNFASISTNLSMP